MSGSRNDAMQITLASMLNTALSALDANVKKQLKQLATKENKQQYLDEYSKNPWCVPGNANQFTLSPQTAFDYFLSLGRVTGKLCDSTESLREYADLKNAKRMLVGVNEDTFLAEATLALDRSEDHPYYARALKHKEARCYLRAILDFEVAKSFFDRHHQGAEVNDCERELIDCYYQSNLHFLAFVKLQSLMEKGVSLQARDQFAGALALITYDKEHPHVRSLFNPLPVLCEALAASQDLGFEMAAFLQEEGVILDLVEKYCPKDDGLMMDLLRLLPEQISRSAMNAFLLHHEESYQAVLACMDKEWDDRQKKTFALHVDIKYLCGDKFIFDDRLLFQHPALEGMHSCFHLPVDSKLAAYPSSALIAYDCAKALQTTDREKAQECIAKSLEINPAFLPARLLSLVLDDSAVSKDSVLIYQSAEALVKLYDSLQHQHQDQRRFCEDLLGQTRVRYLAAKVDLVVHTPHRRACLAHFLQCDPEDKVNYPKACEAVKNKFSKKDRIFNEVVSQLLASDKDSDYMKAIRLCAANDKRTDVNNLLLRNAKVVSCLNGTSRIDGCDQAEVMSFFTEKTQKVIKDYLRPKAGRFLSRPAPVQAPVQAPAPASKKNG
jgi:hypothetical protein